MCVCLVKGRGKEKQSAAYLFSWTIWKFCCVCVQGDRKRATLTVLCVYIEWCLCEAGGHSDPGHMDSRSGGGLLQTCSYPWDFDLLMNCSIDLNLGLLH